MSQQPQRSDDASFWRTGRWLIALLVLLVAMGVLLPLAIDAVREVVALTD